MSAYKPNAFVTSLVLQGGAPGEHYTLTEDEHTYLSHLAEVGIPLFEPVAIDNELVFDGATGDVLMDFMGYV